MRMLIDFDLPIEPFNTYVRDGSAGERDLTARWLLDAEKLAGLPKLAGGQFHPYRRLWATERKNLPVQDVAAAGGWKTVETVQRLYQLADGATTLAAVEGGK